jgi:hypothetical protein
MRLHQIAENGDHNQRSNGQELEDDHNPKEQHIGGGDVRDETSNGEAHRVDAEVEQVALQFQTF